jgi:MoxR-like ATPase
LLLFIGEPGIGKTRMLEHLAEGGRAAARLKKTGEGSALDPLGPAAPDPNSLSQGF